MKYYYARVSTREQNLDRQTKAAEEQGVDRIFADKASGKNLDRAEYQKMKRLLKEGDDVYFLELSRLGRNMNDVREEIQWFDRHGINWHSADIPTSMVDFNGQEWVRRMVNNLTLEIMGTFAEQEREKILERQRQGYEAMPVVNGKKYSKKTGRFCGRPEKEIDISKYFSKQKKGVMTVDECCKELGIGRSTWYNRVKETTA